MRDIIEAAWEDRSLLEQESTQNTIRQVIEQLDLGKLRVAEPTDNGWQVNEWVKKAVVLYFPIQKMETLHAGPMEFHDKMPLKKDYAAKGIRVVPHAVARQGAYISSFYLYCQKTIPATVEIVDIACSTLVGRVDNSVTYSWYCDLERVPFALPRYNPIKEITVICVVKALVDATPISGPAWV